MSAVSEGVDRDGVASRVAEGRRPTSCASWLNNVIEPNFLKSLKAGGTTQMSPYIA